MPYLPSDPPFLREPRPDYANDPRHRRARTAAWITGGLALLGSLPATATGTGVLIGGDARRGFAWLLVVGALGCTSAATALLACNGPAARPIRLAWLCAVIAVLLVAQGFGAVAGAYGYAFRAANLCLTPFAVIIALVGVGLALAARHAVAGYAPAIVYVPAEPANAEAEAEDPAYRRLMSLAMATGCLTATASVPWTAFMAMAPADDTGPSSPAGWWMAGAALPAALAAVALIVMALRRTSPHGLAVAAGIAAVSLAVIMIALVSAGLSYLGAACGCVNVLAIAASGWCAIHALDMVAPSGGGPREPRRRNAH